MNDATDLFRNSLLIQPSIITINGKKINNLKNEKKEKKKKKQKQKKESTLKKTEKSQIEQDFEDSDSYEIILSKILDKPPIEIEKEIESISHTKKQNNNLTVYDDKKHFNHQENKNIKLSTIIKPKENLLVISTDMNLKRRRTSILNSNNLKKQLLCESPSKNDKKDIKTPNRLSSDKNQFLNFNNFQLQSQNFFKTNIIKEVDSSLLYDQKSNNNILKQKKKLNSEEEKPKKKESLKIQTVYNFEIQDKKKNINDKPLYVLTNQIVNINKKNIINKVDKDIINSNNYDNIVITNLKTERKKETKEVYIQTEESKLKKNHINFTVNGKKKSFLCCF